jgi:hypothetical protein
MLVAPLLDQDIQHLALVVVDTRRRYTRRPPIHIRHATQGFSP